MNIQTIIYTLRRYKHFKAICKLEFLSALRRSESTTQFIINYQESIKEINTAGYSLFMTKRQGLKYFQQAIEGKVHIPKSQHQSNGR